MSTVVKDLGAVSAYAYAVEKGYTGTEAEFAELMADYAEVGQRAEDAAESALNSKTAAQTAATTATNKASEATTAAQTATTKAGEAQTSAQTASSKASEASQSASQASGYAQTAETAKTDAQTAKTQAETARDNAVTAKTAAETAQGKAEDAQAAAESVAESIPSDYSQLAEDVSDLKEDLTALAPKEDMLKAFPTDMASGSVASFADGANVPVKSLIVNIDPVQSGSGDPSPDNVRPISGWSEVNVQRTGVNLFPYKDIESQTKNGVTITVEKSNGAITNIHMQGTATTAFSIPFYINGEDDQWVLPKGDCKLYIGGDKPTQGQIFDINIRKAGETSDISAASTVRTITLSEQTAFRSAYIWIYSGAVLNHNIIPVIVQSGVDTSVKYPITQRQSITIQLGQTVYGGKLDVLSGELTVYPYYASYNGETLTGEWISDRDKYVSGTTPTIGAQVVNIGADGTEIQLEPHEIASLLGQNNIFADTGDCSVEYRADTKLYIERLTEPDADMIADSNIVSGQYFMVGNTLYKATANIANGGQIIVGTNAVRKSLSEALNEINA